jgi:hypothetical protein
LDKTEKVLYEKPARPWRLKRAAMAAICSWVIPLEQSIGRSPVAKHGRLHAAIILSGPANFFGFSSH